MNYREKLVMHACFAGKITYIQSYREMSDMWQRKIATFFHRMDLDKDGVISKKDFELIAQRFCAAEKAVPFKEEELRKRMVDVS